MRDAHRSSQATEMTLGFTGMGSKTQETEFMKFRVMGC